MTVLRSRFATIGGMVQHSERHGASHRGEEAREGQHTR